jgi:hypothetical protein
MKLPPLVFPASSLSQSVNMRDYYINTHRRFQATCECDDDHILSDDGQRCVRNPIMLGDPCTSTRQCSTLDAKCRQVMAALTKVWS